MLIIVLAILAFIAWLLIVFLGVVGAIVVEALIGLIGAAAVIFARYPGQAFFGPNHADVVDLLSGSTSYGDRAPGHIDRAFGVGLLGMASLVYVLADAAVAERIELKCVRPPDATGAAPLALCSAEGLAPTLITRGDTSTDKQTGAATLRLYDANEELAFEVRVHRPKQAMGALAAIDAVRDGRPNPNPAILELEPPNRARPFPLWAWGAVWLPYLLMLGAAVVRRRRR